MPQKMPLELVLDKMLQEEKSMMENLEKATSYVQQEKEQLQQLQNYYDDYTHKIAEKQQQWPVERMAHYRSFLSQLVNAVNVQRDKVAQQEQALKAMQQKLVVCQHKISVLGEAIDEQRKDLQKQEDKHQQKELDELAIRLTRPHY